MALERKVTIDTVMYELMNSKEWLKIQTHLQNQAAAQEDLHQRLLTLEARYAERKPSIQRVEEFNGETAPAPEDNLKMKYEDKIQSMLNTIAILPPNLIEFGRHTKENVQALCGFLVTPEMMDDAYYALEKRTGIL